MSNKYYICKTLDSPNKMFGLTFDEFVPGLLIFLFFMLKYGESTGIVLAVITVVSIKYLKKGKGLGCFIAFLYWNLPAAFFGKLFFKNTPESFKRRWLN